MPKKLPRPTIYSLSKHLPSDDFSSPDQAQVFWSKMKDEFLQWDISQAFLNSGRSDLFLALISIYRHVPDARAELLDIITKTHGFQDCFDLVCETQFKMLNADSAFRDVLLDLQDFCLQGGATRLKGFDFGWSGDASPGDLQRLLDDHVLPYMAEADFWRSRSVRDLGRWYPLISSRYGLASVEAVTVRDWAESECLRRGQLHGWLKDQYGLERAVCMGARSINYDGWGRAKWLPIADVLDVYAHGSINTALGMAAARRDDFPVMISKMIMGLVCQSGEQAVDWLKQCERSTVAYWRKAGYVDELTWYRAVGATSKQIDNHFSRDLGL